MKNTEKIKKDIIHDFSCGYLFFAMTAFYKIYSNYTVNLDKLLSFDTIQFPNITDIFLNRTIR